MVTVLVLLCFEENLVGTTPFSTPEPTAWFRCRWCSLVPPVPPPEVFIVLLLFFRALNGDETRKKRDTFLRKNSV